MFSKPLFFCCFKENFNFMIETLKSSFSQFCISLTYVAATSYSSPKEKDLSFIIGSKCHSKMRRGDLPTWVIKSIS